MKHIHGGDIYADNWNEEPLDFSANINPLGMPDSVRAAAQQAIAGCLHYPDPFCRALRRAIAARNAVTPQQVFCGNGAADVLYRLMLTLAPKKILLPAPTFAEYEEAAQAFEKLGDYQQSAQYAAYSRGLVLWEQGDYLNAEPYFEQCQTLLMGGQRYAYCHACALEAAGDAAGAAEAFGKLGDFEDAALHHYYNEGVDAENRKDYEKALYDYAAAGDAADASDRLLNQQGQIYNRAIELREERSYEEAIYLFTILGDYLSSARQAVECEQIFRDEQYSQADAMEMAGDLQGAYDLFSTLTGFRDAAQRASDLASRLGIPDTSESD